MSETFYYRKGAMTLGPFTLEQMRRFAQQGQIGRSHQISGDGGQSWQSGSDVPAIFAAPADREPPPLALGDDALFGGSDRQPPPWADTVPDGDSTPPELPKRRRKGRRKAAGTDAGVSAAGLSGFICSIVAIVMLAIPCLVWVLVAQSFFWIFYAVIPLAVLALLGLVLSVIGLSNAGGRLAVAGTMLGIIAVCMAAMAIGGASTIRYRMAHMRAVPIAAAKTEIELMRKALTDSLAAFRGLRHEADEDEELFRLRQERALQDVGMHLGNLVDGYRNYLTATSMTSEFPGAFQTELPKLRSTVVEVQQAAKPVGMTLADVMHGGMANMQLLKTLDDTLGLHQAGKITISQAEAKMAEQ